MAWKLFNNSLNLLIGLLMFITAFEDVGYWTSMGAVGILAMALAVFFGLCCLVVFFRQGRRDGIPTYVQGPLVPVCGALFMTTVDIAISDKSIISKAALFVLLFCFFAIFLNIVAAILEKERAQTKK